MPVTEAALEGIVALAILLLGLLQVFAAVFVAFTAKSAVHEILATVAFGLGIISIALAIIIAKIDDYVKSR
jgi:Na+/phosphate symporter